MNNSVRLLRARNHTYTTKPRINMTKNMSNEQYVQMDNPYLQRVWNTRHMPSIRNPPRTNYFRAPGLSNANLQRIRNSRRVSANNVVSRPMPQVVSNLSLPMTFSDNVGLPGVSNNSPNYVPPMRRTIPGLGLGVQPVRPVEPLQSSTFNRRFAANRYTRNVRNNSNIISNNRNRNRSNRNNRNNRSNRNIMYNEF